MNAAISNSDAAFCSEIRAEAKRQGDQVIELARIKAKTLLQEANAAAQKNRAQELELARAEALRLSNLIQAVIPIELRRLRDARIEKILQGIHDEVVKCLRSKDLDFRKIILSLVSQAIARMSGQSFTVKISTPGEFEADDSLAEEIVRQAGQAPRRINLLIGPPTPELSILVEDDDGRQIWDNTLSARLSRMWPELRRQLAFQTGIVSCADKFWQQS